MAGEPGFRFFSFCLPGKWSERFHAVWGMVHYAQENCIRGGFGI